MYRGLIVLFISIALAPTILHAQTASPDTVTTNAPAAEDWSTLSLAKSGLPLEATGGMLLSKVELQGGCTRELLRMQWRPLDPIDLYVIRPQRSEKLPVVLFLYNYTYDSNLFREERWCNLAKENGFAVAGFGSALSMQRFHAPRPMKEWFVSELQEALASSTHDVQMILNYLDTRGDLDIQHVGIFGEGSGGAIAILAAAADARIHTLDLMNPWGDWPDWLKESKQIPEDERPMYLTPEFMQRVSNLDPLIYLPQLKDRSLRIQQVMSDPVTPPIASSKIANAVPRANQVGRYPDRTAEAKALGTNGIVRWFGEQLNPR